MNWFCRGLPIWKPDLNMNHLPQIAIKHPYLFFKLEEEILRWKTFGRGEFYCSWLTWFTSLFTWFPWWFTWLSLCCLKIFWRVKSPRFINTHPPSLNTGNVLCTTFFIYHMNNARDRMSLFYQFLRIHR